MDAKVIDQLACPETQQRLSAAPLALIELINAHIVQGEIKNRAQRVLISTLESGLVRQDGKIVYPVVQGVALMLADEGIEVAQADKFKI